MAVDHIIATANLLVRKRSLLSLPGHPLVMNKVITLLIGGGRNTLCLTGIADYDLIAYSDVNDNIENHCRNTYLFITH